MGAFVRLSEDRRKMEIIWTYPGGQESLVMGSYRPQEHEPYSEGEIASTEKYARMLKSGPQECSSHDAPEGGPFAGEWMKCSNYGEYHLLTASDGMREYLCERHARSAVETDDRIAIKVVAVRDVFNLIFDLMFEGLADMDEAYKLREEAVRLWEQMIFPPGYGKRRVEELTPVNPAEEVH